MDYHPSIIINKNNHIKIYRIPSKGNYYRGPDSVTHLIYRGPGGVTPMRKFTEYLNVHILICLYISYLYHSIIFNYLLWLKSHLSTIDLIRTQVLLKRFIDITFRRPVL